MVVANGRSTRLDDNGAPVTTIAAAAVVSAAFVTTVVGVVRRL